MCDCEGLGWGDGAFQVFSRASTTMSVWIRARRDLRVPMSMSCVSFRFLVYVVDMGRSGGSFVGVDGFSLDILALSNEEWIFCAGRR